MKLIIILILLSILSISLNANDDIRLNKKYHSGSIILKNKKIIKARNIIISEDSISYNLKRSKISKSIRVDDTKYLKLPIGNNAGRYAVHGGLFGVGVVLGIILNADPGTKFSDNAPTAFGGIIAVSAGLGALIGLSSSKYKIYKNGKHYNIPKTYDVGLILNERHLGIGLQISF